MFRLVCENGLVISTQEFENVRIRHVGYNFEELSKTIMAMVEKLPLTVESMNKLKNIKLTENQIMEFAKQALEIRFGEAEFKRIKVDFNTLLQPTRKEDEGNGLWEVYNRIQEKVIEGDFNYTVGASTRKARRIKNFQQDIRINTGLWDLALEYIPN